MTFTFETGARAAVPQPEDGKEPKSPERDRRKEPDWHPLDDVQKFYDAKAPLYDKDYENYDWRLYDDLTWHFLTPYLPPEKPSFILDVGGGTGKWAVKLGQMGYKVICGDISDGMLDIARHKVKLGQLDELVEVRKLDVRNLDEFPSNTFDLVLALGDVISYAIDDDPAVAEIFRVCKPGARCIASVDNKLTFLVLELNNNHFKGVDSLLKTNIATYFTPHPIKTYFPAELKDLFQRHGFVVESIVGKPVLTNMVSKNRRKTQLPEHYEFFLNMEKQLASDPVFVGHGGHLQIAAKKPPV
jgi:ubiquinone/menaquinone biosynthesis C-methylase UbiE